MNESEARQKWCPFVRVSVSDVWREKTDNRDFDYQASPPTACIASDCMAWRTSCTESCVSGQRKITYDKDNGFCGLAGKP